MIIGTTDDKLDIDTHSISTLLFYHFNNLRPDFREEVYKVRHNIILNELHAIEKLQSKNWPYFNNCLLEVSDGNISPLNLISVKTKMTQMN